MADFISREAANKALCEFCGICTEPGDLEECEIVSNCSFPHIPAADVRPVVRARWEDETGYIFINLAQRVYCPVCKSYAYFYPITAKNFCPNCGADMREAHHGSP